MTGPRNPFPGVNRVCDRHGKVRWRFRSNAGGVSFSCYLPGPYGSAAFVAAYEAAKNQAKTPKVPERFDRDSLAWLIEAYLRSPGFKDLADSTRRVLRQEMDWLRAMAGDLPFAQCRPKHVEALMAKKDGPAAANKVRKNLSKLFQMAMRMELMTHNPARVAARRRDKTDGFHTWTEAEMAQFLTRHGPGSKARLVFRLAECTGAARADLAALTRGNIRGGQIGYRRGKTKEGGLFQITPELAEELARLPSDQIMLISHSDGQAYKPESLGNWFKDRCKEAGLQHCSIHGIRKGQATRMAEAGATSHELAAFLAHGTTKEAETYTRKADRQRLAASAQQRISGVSVSNLSSGLDKSPCKARKGNEKND